MIENTYEDDYFDKDLELCLKFLSEKKYQYILSKLFCSDKSIWINVHNSVNDENLVLSNNIDFMWLDIPDNEDKNMVIVLFLNKLTMEIVYAYFNLKTLVH
ncbi:hypothetical protein ACEYX6_00755 [Acinetobacter sp. c2-A9]